jgi:hypothetical protein
MGFLSDLLKNKTVNRFIQPQVSYIQKQIPRVRDVFQQGKQEVRQAVSSPQGFANAGRNYYQGQAVGFGNLANQMSRLNNRINPIQIAANKIYGGRPLQFNDKVDTTLNRYQPKSVIGQVGKIGAENAPYALLPGLKMPGVVGRIASPIAKSIAMNSIRGLENAGYGAAMNIGQGKSAQETLRNAPLNFAVGGAANAVFSPKVTGRALSKAGQNLLGYLKSRPTISNYVGLQNQIAKATTSQEVKNILASHPWTKPLADGNIVKPTLDKLIQLTEPQRIGEVLDQELRRLNPTINVNNYQAGKSGGFVLNPFSTEPTGAGNVGGDLGNGTKTLTTGNGLKVEISNPKQQTISVQIGNKPTPIEAKVFEHDGVTLALFNEKPLGGSHQYILADPKTGAVISSGQSEAGAILHAKMDDPTYWNKVKANLSSSTPPVVGGEVTRVKPELPTSLEQSNPNIQKSVQPVVSEGIPQTTPASQTPIELSQKTSSYPQDTPLLTGRQYNLLEAARPTTLKEAKSIFKKTGQAVEFTNVQKPNEKPFIFSENNGQSKDVKVRVLGGDGKEVKVNINALNDVSPETIKDISGIDASFKSVYRNFEKAFGTAFDNVKRRILDPFDASKGAMVVEQENIARQLKNDIVDGLGISKGSRESTLVQQFGEGKITLDELKSETPKWQNIVEADKWFRQQYDTQLAEVNAVRARIYPNNPDKQIQGRKDYYRHFQELTGMEGLKNLFDSPANIPTELAGTSDTTQPKSKFLSFAQKRLGIKTKDDAVGGFINYMRSATYAKHIDQHIEKFRGLADEITTKANESGQIDLGSRFAEYLRDYANDLAGKTNPLDRSVQKIVGRKVFAGINWLNSRVKANVILGNLSSAVAQLGNTPQMMAKAGYRNWAGGFKDFLSPKNSVIDGSDFIKERYSKDIFSQFDTKILDQPKKAVVWITQALDEMATKIGWNGFYRQAVEKGIANPTKYADDLTRSMVGGRGIGEVPLIQKSKVTQLVAPFQLEVQNLMQVLGKEVSDKEVGVLVKYALAAYAFNFAAKQVRGNGVTFDPIQASLDAAKAYQEEDNKGIGVMRAGGRLGGELFSNMMGGQTLASLYPEYGVKVGGETVTRKELFGSKDPTRFGQGLIASAVQNPLYKLIPPFGGAQAEKTVKGLKAYKQGYSADKSGNVQFPIDKNPMNLVKSAMFGKYSTGQAREYFDKNRTALSEKQTGLLKAGAKTYNDFMTERDQNKTMDKMKSGKNTSGTTDLGNDLYQVGDKFYSKSLDKEFNSREKADEAIAGDEFLKTGKASQIIGDKVYRADNSERGYGITTKISYDADTMETKKTRLKKNEDLKGWLDNADKLYKNYKEQLKDQSLDELEKMKIQGKMDDLDTEAKKYAGYGGFTKPKAAKKNAAKTAAITALKNFKVADYAKPVMPTRGKISGVKTITAAELARGR